MEQAVQQMGVGIAGKQQGLKKQHASRPDRRTAAEPRQDGFADDRLDLKNQKCAYKGGDCKPPNDPGAVPCEHAGFPFL